MLSDRGLLVRIKICAQKQKRKKQEVFSISYNIGSHGLFSYFLIPISRFTIDSAITSDRSGCLGLITQINLPQQYITLGLM